MPIQEKEKLFKDRKILRQNGFYVMCVQFTDDNNNKVSVPINTKLAPRTYCVGEGGVFITDEEGITWTRKNYISSDPKIFGLVGYEYYSWSNVIDWSAEK